jgi:hypothetical protein
MKVLRPPLRYPSIEAFYAELPDVDRRLSPELAFGCHWTEPNEIGWTWPRSSLLWVENTGELVVIRKGQFSRRTPPTLKVIAVIEGRDTVEKVLDGWAHHCRAEGLAWVYGRIESAEEKCGTAGAATTGGTQ